MTPEEKQKLNSKIELRTDREILVSVNSKLTSLCAHVERVENELNSDEGSIRCVHRHERISDLEARQKTIDKILVGVSIVVGGTAIVFLAKLFWDSIHMAVAMANSVIF